MQILNLTLGVPVFHGYLCEAKFAFLVCDPLDRAMDVVLLLDGSGSIGPDVFKTGVKNFSKDFASKLALPDGRNQLAIVQFGGYEPRTEVELRVHTDLTQVNNDINVLRIIVFLPKFGFF